MLRDCRLGFTCSLFVLLCITMALDAHAQDPVTVGPFAVDLRAAMPRLGQNEDLASQRKLSVLQLPSWGLGVDVGGHVYPVKWKTITFGVGVQTLFSQGRRSPNSEEITSNPDLPVIRTKFTTIAPQLSFNFSGTSGWSYISGGLGASTFNVGSSEAERDDRWFRTINYGGGGRWFAKDHLGFSLDLRFYGISPQGGTDKLLALPRMRVVVLSIGVAFK